MSFDSSIVVILAWNRSGRDLSTFLTILGSGMVSSRLNARVHYVFKLGIELVKRLIFLNLNLFKACSEPLKLWVFDNLSSLIGCLKDGPSLLGSFSWGYLLKLLIGDCIEQRIQCSAVEVRRLDLGIILVCWCFLWLGPTYLNSLPHFLI